MEKRNGFYIIESLTEEELKESFERLRKKVIKILADFRKNNNQNIRAEELSYTAEKFIKIDIDGIFSFGGKYLKEYNFDMEKSFYGSNIKLLDITFNNPVTGINTVFELVIDDMKEFTKKSNLVYKDDINTNIIDDFVSFIDYYLLLIIDNYSMLEFNCLRIRKYGSLIQIGAENRPEMTDDYKLASSMNFFGSENKKRYYSLEEIQELKLLDNTPYENFKIENREISH